LPTSRFGDIEIAEEAAGEALVAALEKWPESGPPPNPGGWLTTTASNRAIDRIRREKQRDAKHQAALMIPNFRQRCHRASLAATNRAISIVQRC
jgi:predicted RNA polymerase sigma factor